MTDRLRELFGEPIHIVTRAQLIEAGELIDLTNATDDRGGQLCEQAGFKVPVAITRGAFAATVEAGGKWVPDGDGETLELPGGQSMTGRLWDVLWMLRCAIGGCAQGQDRLTFQVLVDKRGKGRPRPVTLKSICGPGVQGEPVITILLLEED